MCSIEVISPKEALLENTSKEIGKKSFGTWIYLVRMISFGQHFINETHETHFGGFKELQYVTFPKLKFPKQCPKPEYLMKFLEINGKNLKEFYI